MKSFLSMVFLLFLLSFTVVAQNRSLTIEDYGRFRSVSSVGISEKGNWAGYSYDTPRKDDTLYIENITTGKKFTIPFGRDIKFSDDEKWAAYKIVLAFKKQESLKKEKKPVTVKVQIINLETGVKEDITNISTFAFTRGSDLLLVHLAKTDPKSKNAGKDLIVKHLTTGFTSRYSDVSAFTVNKPGSAVAFTVEAPDSTGNGLFIIESTSGIKKPLDTDKMIFSKPTWNEEGTSIAVMKGINPKGKKQRQNSLLSFTSIDSVPVRFEYDPTTDSSFPEGYVISENGTPGFSNDLSIYYFGISKQDTLIKKKKDAPAVANVDIWHWNDERIQSVQMKQAAREKRFTYISSVSAKEKKFILLADSTMKNLTISRDGKHVMGYNNKPYISDWKPNMADYYIVNPVTGDRKLLIKAQQRTYRFSPDSKNYLFWKDGDFWNYEFCAGMFVNITSNSEVSFINEEFDRPGEKPPYGVAGWTRDGKYVLLYSRYDIWLQPLDGTPATNITSEYGTENEIVLRYIKTDQEEKFIDIEKTMLLSAYGQWTKKAGFFRLDNNKPEKLIYTDNRYGRLVKLRKADKYLFTRESPSEYSDYYFADLSFKKIRKITNANPWVDDYKWYHNELIEYTNSKGVRLQAVLMIPDDYKKGERYPMIVDFYEKNSQNLNRWSRIIYRDTPMFPKYASNGYLVLLPDVHFNIGSTHSDHLECVEAAVNKVIELGYADQNKIGIHGHSFSGQGGNYIVTHSSMFACAVIGAGASNLISDFNQLWKSSGSNQHGYNYYGQGRYATNPYDDFDLYVDQSAVYHARDMNTPLMLFHGTADGSVEWLQAIEFYNGLRFNNKNVILCSYPGEGHHLSKWENKVDFQTRMEQFYDHYLKGTKAPDWMINGIPFLKKEANK